MNCTMWTVLTINRGNKHDSDWTIDTRLADHPGFVFALGQRESRRLLRTLGLQTSTLSAVPLLQLSGHDHGESWCSQPSPSVRC